MQQEGEQLTSRTVPLGEDQNMCGNIYPFTRITIDSPHLKMYHHKEAIVMNTIVDELEWMDTRIARGVKWEVFVCEKPFQDSLRMTVLTRDQFKVQHWATRSWKYNMWHEWFRVPKNWCPHPEDISRSLQDGDCVLMNNFSLEDERMRVRTLLWDKIAGQEHLKHPGYINMNDEDERSWWGQDTDEKLATANEVNVKRQKNNYSCLFAPY